jgi:hypothetical protein
MTGDDELGFVDSMVHIRSAFFPLATMQKVERAMLYEDCTRSSPAPRAFFAYIRAAETSSTSFPPLGLPTKHCIRESSAISPGWPWSIMLPGRGSQGSYHSTRYTWPSSLAPSIPISMSARSIVRTIYSLRQKREDRGTRDDPGS